MAREGVLLDARAAERYRGEVEPADPVAGHIPAAISAPTSQNVGAGRALPGPGRVAGPVHRARAVPACPAVRVTARPVARAAAGRRAAAWWTGRRPGRAVTTGVYCGSGVTAAHEVLALTIAGIPAALYVGSWSDWVTDPARPVATGPAPA